MNECNKGVQKKKTNFNTLEPGRPQHNRSAAYVIAQQYSSSASLSLPFHSRKKKKKKIGARLKKKYFFHTFTFQKVV
jgi:hypothetical protein